MTFTLFSLSISLYGVRVASFNAQYGSTVQFPGSTLVLQVQRYPGNQYAARYNGCCFESLLPSVDDWVALLCYRVGCLEGETNTSFLWWRFQVSENEFWRIIVVDVDDV